MLIVIFFPQTDHNDKKSMAKCTKAACCFHLRYTNSITILTTSKTETCIFYPTFASNHTLNQVLSHHCFVFCFTFAVRRHKKKQTEKKPTSLPTYLNAYRQSSNTRASSACVYRAAAATLDPESQWAHSASDAHLFQGSQRATKQQTLIPM